MGRRGPRHGGFRQSSGGGISSGGNNSGIGSERGAMPPPPPQIIAEEQLPPVRGPHPGFIKVAAQYTLEHKLRQMQRDNGCDPAREINYRLQGVQLIDSVREALQLPVRTFATACTYYHKFRLNFRDAEYLFQDAALTSLFVACKVEDTIKKSREILCASYNLKNPDKPTTPDDKLFDKASSVIVGLDRHILQTVGFDFRARHPHKTLVKLIRKLIPGDDARGFLVVAYPMMIDLYKTFAPIKQTSFTMAFAVMELTARLLTMHIDKVAMGQPPLDARHCHTTRDCVIETLLDLLDLYTEFSKSTKVGPRFELNRFIDIKIKINREVDENRARGSAVSTTATDTPCAQCAATQATAALAGPFTGGVSMTVAPNMSPTAARFGSASGSGAATATATATAGPTGPAGQAGQAQKRHEGTLRYMLEAEKMQAEVAEVAEYYKEEYDEEEIEVEELISEPPPPPPPPQPPRGGHHHNSQHGHHGKPYHGSHNGGGHGSRGHGPSRRDRSHRGGGGGGGIGNGAASANGNGESAGWAPYPRSRNDRHKQRKGGGGGGSSGGGFY